MTEPPEYGWATWVATILVVAPVAMACSAIGKLRALVGGHANR